MGGARGNEGDGSLGCGEAHRCLDPVELALDDVEDLRKGVGQGFAACDRDQPDPDVVMRDVGEPLVGGFRTCLLTIYCLNDSILTNA